VDVTEAAPTRTSRILWRVHLALTVVLSLSIVALTLAYRYYSGDWSRLGLLLAAIMIGSGGTGWLLRPKEPRA
jgi:hypothetical protein